jgi:peptidyl-prolyl cis-trans isomerase A (cyclophilin A)
MLRALLSIALILFAMPATAQTAAVPPPAPEPATTRVVMRTAMGDITLAIETERAPLTAANFLRYVDARRYDGQPLYRAMTIGENSGLIQGGIRDSRRLYPPIAHEATTRTGLSHTDGAISMARGALGSARADFFIIVGPDMVGLDAGPSSGGDGQGFAVFGRVVEGMDVVRRIRAAPVSATAGEGAMRGEMLEPEIRILSVRRQAD